MNITSADPTAPPPQPPHPPSSACPRHPTEQFTGFCPSCLFDRLTTLDPSAAAPRRPSSAIKALFSATSRPTNLPPPPPPPLPKPTSSFLPELRRTKSFSASRNEALGVSAEPHRKSCDVRSINQTTLWSLLTENPNPNPNPIESSSRIRNPFLDEVEIEEEFKDSSANIEDIAVSFRDEITPIQQNRFEILEEDKSANFTKPTMKDHIDLVSAADKKKSSGGVFWAAASVFSKKWLDWRHKQKPKKQSHRANRLPPSENPISRQHHRDTQSEVADYGYGRRSVDVVDTRFSLDAGRISFDDARYSLDEPRASYDGYLIGKSFPRMSAPMVAVLEDAAPQSSRASRADMEMPLDLPESLPGGSAQTRNYYLDSSSKRRKSVELERSNSIRKSAAAVVAEIDELKTGADYFQREALRDAAYPNSSKEYVSETLTFDPSNKNQKKEKSKKWGWKIWGFMHRKNPKGGDEKSSSVNGVDRSMSQSWQESRRDDDRNSLVRSNSSVSWRQGNGGGGGGGARRSSVDVYGSGKIKRSGEVNLDKNRNNVRYSPNNVDNGLLRFYLTPHRSNHRRGGTGKVKPTNSNPVVRSSIRM